MKKIEREYTKVEKEVYYEAWDGSRFSEQKACEEYENNARGVVGKRVQEFLIKRTNEYELYNPFGCGYEDDDVEIYLPQSEKDIESLNLYMNFHYKDAKLIDENCIGKYVVIEFNYDRDWCDAHTFDEMLNNLKEHFDKLVKKEEEKSE